MYQIYKWFCLFYKKMVEWNYENLSYVDHIVIFVVTFQLC